MSTDVGSARSAGMAEMSTIDMNLEVLTLPMADVDRAKSFYQGLGWRFDITDEPGSAQDMFLVVQDAARDELIRRGAGVSEPQEARPPGYGPEEERSYFARASFSDPGGNRWVLQEITTRLPGREWED
jgi:catechol 2,3-dioxygenase-like lactoylglutathione lyase family enzyme